MSYGSEYLVTHRSIKPHVGRILISPMKIIISF